jgi:alpha-N-arabinofuranosidase
LDWCYLRHPVTENYRLEADKIKLKGTPITLDIPATPTFIGIRQKDFNAIISCEVSLTNGEAGITLYMDENHHYDLALRKHPEGYEIIERLNIGDIKSIEKTKNIGQCNHASLVVKSSPTHYHFYIQVDGTEILLGAAQTKYLSSEIAGGFTGVLIGLYATGEDQDYNAIFTNFSCLYS